ncbi:helix-turn-helix domain-containing protein [Chelatococcus reniformis]|uniref:Transcriptional regulator n=1 Tax=Chelatococcus reniformis TaxID=1494448 RepID=A0A916TXR6_9HYPH|nr:helix-turn-helix transcriptional regulator [Chelatococcus reniformis]GGC50880.1 transcriptional regulator [Chelatococcus reniformis]
MIQTQRTVGDHLRDWRQRRRLSQLDLALEAEISTKHLSFLETGRSQPSRDMLLLLAEHLDIPLRERNVLMVAAGFAPVFPERALDDPALTAARAAVDLVLRGHEPYPALAIDRHWTMLAANGAVAPLMAGVAPALLKSPVNVMRLALHPDGLAPHTANLPEWRGHLLARLRHQVEVSADPVLIELLSELKAYPTSSFSSPRLPPPEVDHASVVVPFQLVVDGTVLAFISTTTVFGTPVDITLAELALETFFPADAATADVLKRMGEARAR